MKPRIQLTPADQKVYLAVFASHAEAETFFAENLCFYAIGRQNLTAQRPGERRLILAEFDSPAKAQAARLADSMGKAQAARSYRRALNQAQRRKAASITGELWIIEAQRREKLRELRLRRLGEWDEEAELERRTDRIEMGHPVHEWTVKPDVL